MSVSNESTDRARLRWLSLCRGSLLWQLAERVGASPADGTEGRGFDK